MFMETNKTSMYKEIPGFEEYYLVSENGDVFSKRSQKVIRHDVNKKNKVHTVRLSISGKTFKTSVARLMAMTFIDNPAPKLYTLASVINGDHNDLRVLNIAWSSPFQAITRKNVRNPDLITNFIKSGTRIDNSKMSDQMINDLITMRNLGYSAKQLSTIFPIGRAQVYNILKKHQ
jgi:hypothetical protein